MRARFRASLRAGVGGETKSYGFALIVWGAGSLAAAKHGAPSELDVIAYVAGVFAAMAIMILITFGGPTAAKTTTVLTRYSAGAIHLGSVIGALVAGWLLALIGPTAPSFLLTGFGATLTFQVLLGLEVDASIKGTGLASPGATAGHAGDQGPAHSAPTGAPAAGHDLPRVERREKNTMETKTAMDTSSRTTPQPHPKVEPPSTYGESGRSDAHERDPDGRDVHGCD